MSETQEDQIRQVIREERTFLPLFGGVGLGLLLSAALFAVGMLIGKLMSQ